MHTAIVMAHQVEQRRLAKEFEADQRVTVKQDTAEGAISPRVQKMRQRAEQRREARQRKARRQDDLRYTDVCRGDLLVNARRIMSVVNFLQEIRGLVMFALFFAMYFAHTTRVLDSTRGLETLSWIADAATTSNRYESLGTVDALVDWSVQDLYQMMRQVHEYCPKCLLGLSIIDRDLRVLTLKQMVCSDFDFPKTSLTGRQLIGEGSQVSFSPRDCAKENDRWAKQPVVESAPCCNSRDELALASLTLLALDLNVETPTMPLDKLRELETRTSALDSYVRSTLDMAAPLVQLIVLMPDAHALGITFTANWRDPVNLPKRILTERAYWSYYYEPKPVFLLVAIAFCVLSTLHEVFEQWGMAHTAHDAVRNVFSPFMLLIELPSIILPWVCEASAYALRLPDYAIAVAIIELLMFARVFQEGQVLPPFRIVVRTLIFAMPQLAWFTTAMVTTVCVFAGISKQLFGTVDSATSQVRAGPGGRAEAVGSTRARALPLQAEWQRLASCLGVVRVVATVTRRASRGLTHTPSRPVPARAFSRAPFRSRDHLRSQYGDAFISMFSVAISGQASDGPAFALRPFSANLMFVVVNIFLFLIIAQFFIGAARARAAAARRRTCRDCPARDTQSTQREPFLPGSPVCVVASRVLVPSSQPSSSARLTRRARARKRASTRSDAPRGASTLPRRGPCGRRWRTTCSTRSPTCSSAASRPT